MYKRVTVGLREDVYIKLKKEGKFGESYSDLISRLLGRLKKVEEGGP